MQAADVNRAWTGPRTVRSLPPVGSGPVHYMWTGRKARRYCNLQNWRLEEKLARLEAC